MAYFLGIDLGTTYTAAARWRDGRASIARLGSHSAEIPSVVLLKENGEVITGEAAERRSLIEPHRVAREFKRRIGDPTPLILGGTPCSAEQLMAKLLRWVVDKVADDEGSQPLSVAVSHPANWGDYKQDLLHEAIRLAELADVTLVVEPEAAAIHYASQERVEPGSVLAVYDLGGGTFDAAVLRRTGVGWEILGQPEGVDRLGGIDFDAAVLRHVARSIGDAYDALDPDDPPVLAAAARLRQECVSAKEALASDTDVSIPVLLPHLQTEVRLTRAEFEAMIRPALAESLVALERALRSARVERDGVSRILLVGGSSRIPLVGEMVVSSLGRPIAVDAHPKHGVALGAAIVAAQEGHERLSSGVHAVLPEGPSPAYAALLAAGVGSPVGAMPAAPGPGPDPDPSPALVTAGRPATGALSAGASSYQVPSLAPASSPGTAVAVAERPTRRTRDGSGNGKTDAVAEEEPQRPTLALLAGGAALLAAVVLVGMVLVSTGRDADANGDVPGPLPSTIPGTPGPAVVAPQAGGDGQAPAAPAPGVTTIPLPGVTTTVGPRATTTTAPSSASTTTTPSPTTTEPPSPTTTEPPPPTTTEPPPPTTTEPPQPTGARDLP